MPRGRLSPESSTVIQFIRTDRRAAAAIVALVSVQALMSIRVIFKYVDTLPWVAFGLFMLAVVATTWGALSSDRLLRLVTRPQSMALALICLLAIVAIVYPKADALKFTGRGSDQDDCVRVLVNNVFALRPPYGYGTFNDPCSTGPTEFFVYFPVQISTRFFILVPALSLLLGLWVLIQVVDRQTAILLSLTQFASLLFVQISAVGSDLIIIGWLFAAAIVASRKGSRAPSTSLTIVGAIAYALFAGSRVPLVLVTVASLGVLLIACGSRAWRVIVPAVLLPSAVYFGSYLIAPSSFRPWHLVDKSGRILRYLGGDDLVFVLVILVALLAVLAFLVLRITSSTFVERHYFSTNFLLIVFPMATVTFWDLSRKDGNLGTWEGLHYLYLAVPTLLVMVGCWLRAAAEGVISGLKPSATSR